MYRRLREKAAATGKKAAENRQNPTKNAMRLKIIKIFPDTLLKRLPKRAENANARLKRQNGNIYAQKGANTTKKPFESDVIKEGCTA